MSDGNTIGIFGREDAEDRGIFDRLQEFRFGRGVVGVEELKQSISHFLLSMKSVVEGVPATLGKFELDTVSIAVEVSAKGQVSLLGTGGEFAGKGGLTFKLTRQRGDVSA
jgi:hypothetical protein